MPVPFFSLPYEASVQSTYWGSRPELVEVLELGARDLVRPDARTYALDEALTAYDDLRSGRLLGRAVVVP